jgi:excisionase family DNA binding protein
MRRLKKPGIAPPMPEIMTAQEISELLRVHPGTIYRLANERQIPGFRVGSEWRFDVDTIDCWSRGEPATVRVRDESKP